MTPITHYGYTLQALDAANHDTQLNLHYAYYQPLNWWSNMYGPTCILSLLRPLPEEHGKADEIEGVVMVEVGN